jgi:hypothetical protein
MMLAFVLKDAPGRTAQGLTVQSKDVPDMVYAILPKVCVRVTKVTREQGVRAQFVRATVVPMDNAMWRPKNVSVQRMTVSLHVTK